MSEEKGAPLTPEQRKGEAFQYYLGGSDLEAIAEALEYSSVEELDAEISAQLWELTSDQRRAYALYVLKNLEPSLAHRDRLIEVARILRYSDAKTAGADVDFERQRQGLLYRAQGHDYASIAVSLGYVSADGKPNPGSAYKAIQRALKATMQEAADELRAVELMRLDQMQVEVFGAALKGDLMAVGTVLSIMSARARLAGLDKVVPQQMNVGVTWGQVVQGAIDQANREQNVVDQMTAMQKRVEELEALVRGNAVA